MANSNFIEDILIDEGASATILKLDEDILYQLRAASLVWQPITSLSAALFFDSISPGTDIYNVNRDLLNCETQGEDSLVISEGLIPLIESYKSDGLVFKEVNGRLKAIQKVICGFVGAKVRSEYGDIFLTYPFVTESHPQSSIVIQTICSTPELVFDEAMGLRTFRTSKPFTNEAVNLLLSYYLHEDYRYLTRQTDRQNTMSIQALENRLRRISDLTRRRAF